MISSREQWDRLKDKAEETRTEFELPKSETSVLRSIWKWIRIVFYMVTR
jgi:hypothetical protein